MNYIKVVTEKVEGGWRVRVVYTNWGCIHVGYTLCRRGYFGAGQYRFKSRRAAREDILRYELLTHARIIGGLH